MRRLVDLVKGTVDIDNSFSFEELQYNRNVISMLKKELVELDKKLEQSQIELMQSQHIKEITIEKNKFYVGKDRKIVYDQEALKKILVEMPAKMVNALPPSIQWRKTVIESLGLGEYIQIEEKEALKIIELSEFAQAKLTLKRLEVSNGTVC